MTNTLEIVSAFMYTREDDYVYIMYKREDDYVYIMYTREDDYVYIMHTSIQEKINTVIYTENRKR